MIRIHFAAEDLSQSKNRLAIACGVVRKNADGTGDPHPYEGLAEYGRDRWCARPLQDSDVVVYALPYREDEDTRAAEEAARAAGLPCVFFRPNDDPTPVAGSDDDDDDVRYFFDESLVGRPCTCEGGSHIEGTNFAGRVTYQGVQTGRKF